MGAHAHAPGRAGGSRSLARATIRWRTRPLGRGGCGGARGSAARAGVRGVHARARALRGVT
eukprot:4134048-Prymnesium_polylepis.1